jgi:hypothetical protein
MKSSLEAAAATVKRFIRLGKEFHKIHNFNGLMEILGGLNNSSVQRLKKVWELVPEKSRDQFQRLEELMEAKQNYKNYREHIAEIERNPKKFKLPCVAVLLRDLTFAQVGNSTLTETGEVNLDKLKILNEQVRHIQLLQHDCIEYADFDKWSDQAAQSTQQRDSARLILFRLPHITDADLLDELSSRFDNPDPTGLLGAATGEAILKSLTARKGHTRNRSLSDSGERSLYRSKSSNELPYASQGAAAKKDASSEPKSDDAKSGTDSEKEMDKTPKRKAESHSSSPRIRSSSSNVDKPNGDAKVKVKSKAEPSGRKGSGGTIKDSRSKISSLQMSVSSSSLTEEESKKAFSPDVLFMTKKQARSTKKRLQAQRSPKGRSPTIPGSPAAKDPSVVCFFMNRRAVVPMPGGVTLERFLEGCKGKHDLKQMPCGFVYQGSDGGRAEVMNDVDFKQFKLHVFENVSKHRKRIWLLASGDDDPSAT